MRTGASSFLEVTLGNMQTGCHLRHDGTCFLPANRCLLVADLHLGKDASFRSMGIPVPAQLNAETLSRLDRAVHETRPQRAVILGDLVHDQHSLTNAVIDQFDAFLSKQCDIEFQLVLGNHDRRAISRWPKQWRLMVRHSITIDRMQLVHDIAGVNPESNAFVVGGHWHPVVRLGGRADAVRVPCFVLGESYAVLPAFGPVTGGRVIARATADQTLIAAADGRVWEIKSSDESDSLAV